MSNDQNKSQFIKLVGKYLSDNRYEVIYSLYDADSQIVKCDLANSNKTVTVVADDTDALILLVYHFKTNMAEIYKLSPAKGKNKKISKYPEHSNIGILVF